MYVSDIMITGKGKEGLNGISFKIDDDKGTITLKQATKVGYYSTTHPGITSDDEIIIPIELWKALYRGVSSYLDRWGIEQVVT